MGISGIGKERRRFKESPREWGDVVFPTFTVVPERITSKPLRILIFLDYKKIFIIIFFIYANKSFYNNKNLDILPILAYIH